MTPTPQLKRGLIVLRLIQSGGSWSHRRVYSIAMVGEQRMRMRASVDVTPGVEIPMHWRAPLLSSGIESVLGQSEDVPVPLATLAKKPLVAFDLADADGRTLPLLTRSQNHVVAYDVLCAAAVTQDVPLTDEVRQLLWDIAGGDDPHAALDALHADGRWNTTHPSFQTITSALVDSFLLLVNVPIVQLDQRRVIKFSWDQNLPDVSAKAGPERVARTRRITAAIQTVGWRLTERTYQLPVYGVGDSESVHIEFEAPEGAQIHDLEMKVTEEDGTEVAARRAGGPGRAHAYTSGHSVEATAQAHVRLQVRPGGMLRSVTTAVVASMLLMLAGSFARDQLLGLTSDSETAAALLLAIPATIAAYLARPAEHNVVSILYRPTRAISAISALVGYCAAILLTVDLTDGHRMLGWRLLSVVAVAIAALSLEMTIRAEQGAWKTWLDLEQA